MSCNGSVSLKKYCLNDVLSPKIKWTGIKFIWDSNEITQMSIVELKIKHQKTGSFVLVCAVHACEKHMG